MIYYDVIIIFVILILVKLSNLAKSIQTKTKKKEANLKQQNEDCVIEIEEKDKIENEMKNFVFRIDGPYGSAHQVKTIIYFKMK